MKTGLHQGQAQVQTLAPRLRQGLKILALSLPELRSELLSEMAKNPVIDDIEPTLEKTTISEQVSARDAAVEERDYPEDDNTRDAAYLDGFNRGTSGTDPEAIERRQQFFDRQVREETLEEHLLAQLVGSDIDERDYPVAELLIGELDAKGWFVGSVPDIAMVTGESEPKVRAVLAAIREFDPPGCGATTLEECLLAQLDQIADRDLRARVKALIPQLAAVATGEVADTEALKVLRTLEPRPGRGYRHGGHGVEYVNPEVHAVRRADGWEARVDARSLPEIRISRKYLAMLEDPAATPETKAYIRERIAAAKALREAVEKRHDTVVAVAQEIFDRQGAFFEAGLKGLKPLTMQEVAEATGVSLSTVSRTVNGKYAATPKGTVELRRFFTQGVKTGAGEEVVRDEVLARLRELVAAEDKAQPLADERLAAQLKESGFPVARRTVAKYRSLAGIPGAAERKR